jgi:DNA-binding transcriptional LysR family regulator
MRFCMFEWDDARYFLAVHRTGSLTAAGRQLGVNQSTVSRRMHALEEALGARLFLQTPDGYFLSPAGERLLPRAARMEDEALALEREATGQEARLTGPVRVTGADAFSARVLAPLLADFHARTPGIDVELIADTRTLSLTKREADLAVRTARPKEPSLVLRRICGLASAGYASTAYGKVVKAGDLSSHPFLSAEDPTWSENLWLARVAPGARVVFKSNSTEAQLAATRKGIGIGILPCYVGDAEQGLVRVLGPHVVVTRDLWLVMHRDLQHSARIRACADFLAEAIAARAPEFEGVSKPGYPARPKKSSGQGAVLSVETHRLGAAPSAARKRKGL